MLAGKTVNAKWYLKREGILDMTEAPKLDYYLVLAGPKARTADVKTARAWGSMRCTSFDSQQLLAPLRSRGVRIGVASSIREPQWLEGEIYLSASNDALSATDQQRQALARLGALIVFLVGALKPS